MIVTLAAGGLVSVLFIFTPGEPDLAVVEGETYTLAQVTQTMEVPALRPTPGPFHRDVSFISAGANTGMVWATKPPGSRKWDLKRQGRAPPWPSGTTQEWKVATLKLAPGTIASLNGPFRAWHKVDDVDSPTTVLSVPTVTYTVTSTP
jgi:hypothetical protein